MTLTIISGASRGIGKAMAEDLSNTIKGEFILLDSKFVDFKDYEIVYWKVRDCFKGLEIDRLNLILCAAQIGENESVVLSEIDKLYRINVLGNFAVIMAAVFDRFTPKVRIVWFAGGGAAFPYPEFFGYSLSKTAVVRAVENLSITIREYIDDSSIIALAPGAVETDMLKTVLDAGCEVRTRTDISEPVNFVRKFIIDEFDSLALNGMFLHVRDDIKEVLKARYEGQNDRFKLRRIE